MNLKKIVKELNRYFANEEGIDHFTFMRPRKIICHLVDVPRGKPKKRIVRSFVRRHYRDVELRFQYLNPKVTTLHHLIEIINS